METILSIVSFILLLALIGVLAYLYIQLVKLSVKLNDLKYYAQRPQIPFQNKADFPYTVNSYSKNLV